MEKVEYVERTLKETQHSFYCDKCNKHLGISKEQEDGWYDTIGEFELAFYIDDWYKLKKVFCRDCKDEFISNLKTCLEDIGFNRLGKLI